MFSPMQPDIKFNIKQLLMIATNPCKPIYNRSYTLNTTNQILEKLYHLARPQGMNSHHMTDTQIASQIPEIIDMDPVIAGEANVPYGWNTERLRFIMEVEYDFLGSTMAAYLQGFTEYHDPSYTDKIDPSMKFYINSITTVIKRIDPITHMMIVQPYTSYNILANMEDDTPNYGVQSNYKKLIRPQDLFNNYYLNEKYAQGEDVVFNLTDELTPNNIVTSRRMNNNPMEYLAKGLEAYRCGRIATDTSWDQQSAMDNAKSSVAEPTLANNPFLFALTNLTGMVAPNYFSLDMLMRMDPNIIQKVKKFNRMQAPVVAQYNTMLNTDDPSETIQPTVENLRALFLVNIISSLCIDCLISKCTISLSNASGEPTVFITEPGSIVENLDMISFLDKLELKIKQTVMPKLTEYNQLLVEAFISCDILGDFTVGISINNNPMEVFRYPVYADGLFTPMITNNVNKNNFLDNFHTALDSTYGNMTTNTSYHATIDDLS